MINQTYKNIEIILINDGSKDNTDEICRKYAEQDKRIKYICKENSGVSNTRNMALDNSLGDYILFVDGDDWLLTDCVEILINNIKDYDIVRFNSYVQNKAGEWKVEHFSEYEHTMSKSEIYDLPINIVARGEFEKNMENMEISDTFLVNYIKKSVLKI